MFKGSGFYQTDYRSESYKKAAEADRKKSSDSKSESSGSKPLSDKKSSSDDSGSK
jgi:predicted nucleic acid-binding Zn ribbon protein